MGEIKQTNFRIDSEAADRFRQYCDAEGLNQAQGFDHLIEILELDKAKTAVPQMRTDIEAFETAQKAALSAYLHLIEINDSAEARAREQFAGALARQEKTIDDLHRHEADLQEKLQTVTDEAAVAAERAAADIKAANDAKAAAEAARDAAENTRLEATNSAAATQKMNAMLQEKIDALQSQLEGYPSMQEDLAKSEADLAAAKAELRLAAEKAAHTEEKHAAELTAALAEAAVAAEKSKAEAVAAVREKLDALHEEHRQEIKDLRADHAARVKDLEDKLQKATDTIDSLRKQAPAKHQDKKAA